MRIEEFKSSVTSRGGILPSNRFKVTLPAISGISAKDADLLCVEASSPGRQIVTQPRRIGLKEEKIADGFAVDDVTLRFYLTADSYIKRYFESWIELTVPSRQGVIRYKTNYQKPVKISQLHKDETVSYTTTLLDAFPTTLQAVELGAEQTNTLTMYAVQMSYTDFITD